jgi:hypothetical protein
MKKKDMDNITLSKVKLINGGGLEISYREIVRDGAITDKIDWTTKNSINPHPDLVKKIAELKPFLARCYGLNAIDVLRNAKSLSAAEKKAFETTGGLIDRMTKEILDKIAITGIAISGEINGEKDGRACVITGTMLQENNVKTAINSPRIKFNQDVFKFEGNVQDIVNKIEEEVNEYLFENKKAQLDMFASQEQKLSEDFVKGDIKKGKKVAENEEKAA